MIEQHLYIFGHRGRQPWLSVSIILLKIYVSKNIVLNVLFIVEVFENKYYYYYIIIITQNLSLFVYHAFNIYSVFLGI